MSDIREAVQKYIDDGFAVVPIAAGSKAPYGSDWLKKVFTPEDFNEGDGVGIKCGEPSNWLVDVDLDVPEARAAARDLLLETGLVHGRSSAPASHYWFFCEGAQPDKYTDTDGKMLVEIRTTGGQTVIPPSFHPSGEQHAWLVQKGAATVEYETLRAHVRYVAVAVLLARHWPKGSRHYAARDAAGFLAQQKIAPSIVERIVTVAARLAGDDEVSDRARVARDTCDAFDKNKKTTGAPTLAQNLTDGDKVVAKLRQWCGASHSEIDRLNERFFIVDVGPETCVGEEINNRDARGRTWTDFAFRAFSDFKKKLIKEYIRVGTTKGGDPIYEPLAEHWLRSRAGRQYERLIYAPPGSETVIGPNDLNGWKGFTVEPQPGNWTKTRAFLENVICDGEPRDAAFLFDWIADLLQRPGVHAETALLLLGSQGTGKNFFTETVLGDCFDGRHFRTVRSPKQVLGEFNDVLSGLCLMLLDEVGLTDKAEANRAKSLITTHTLDINRKGIAIAKERSMLHVIFASNDDNPLPIDQDDRRFAFLRVSKAHQNDTAYFRDIADELANGGRAAMLHDLLAGSVNRDQLRLAPVSRAKREAKRENWTPAQVFLAGLLETIPRQQWSNTPSGQREATSRYPRFTGERRLKRSETTNAYIDMLARAGVRMLDPDRDLHKAIKAHVPNGFTFDRAVKDRGVVSKEFWTLPAWSVFRVSFVARAGIELADLRDSSPKDGEPIDDEGISGNRDVTDEELPF